MSGGNERGGCQNCAEDLSKSRNCRDIQEGVYYGVLARIAAANQAADLWKDGRDRGLVMNTMLKIGGVASAARAAVTGRPPCADSCEERLIVDREKNPFAQYAALKGLEVDEGGCDSHMVDIVEQIGDCVGGIVPKTELCDVVRFGKALPGAVVRRIGNVIAFVIDEVREPSFPIEN
ncbi:hypothetical protein HOE67_02725 [Candidatus Peregrinibacteria bacterium]|jgi:hypothetical protein|nr:hypothetical protein [Candidatus Peregrinibacteria bacterium]MBT4056001.1 hypothetical protein [Candidatus Peregrinibacteria bacterium]